MSIEPVDAGGASGRGKAATESPDAASLKRLGRELWSSRREPDEVRRGSLTWSERLWVYNVFMLLLPVYAAVAVAAALLAGDDGWRDGSSVWPGVTVVIGVFAALHLWSWSLEMTIGGGRRAKAVLSRPLREGRHVWATASGDRVRVYRLEREPSHVPHLLPLSLGVRSRVAEGREFSADDEADAAYEYAAELERTSRPHLAATAIAAVINQRGRVRPTTSR